jgi:hypothetical protein
VSRTLDKVAMGPNRYKQQRDSSAKSGLVVKRSLHVIVGNKFDRPIRLQPLRGAGRSGAASRADEACP